MSKKPRNPAIDAKAVDTETIAQKASESLSIDQWSRRHQYLNLGQAVMYSMLPESDPRMQRYGQELMNRLEHDFRPSALDTHVYRHAKLVLSDHPTPRKTGTVSMFGGGKPHTKGRSKRGWTSDPKLDSRTDNLLVAMIEARLDECNVNGTARALDLPPKYVAKRSGPILAKMAADRKLAKDTSKEETALYHAWLGDSKLHEAGLLAVFKELRRDYHGEMAAVRLYNAERSNLGADKQATMEVKEVLTWAEWLEKYNVSRLETLEAPSIDANDFNNPIAA